MNQTIELSESSALEASEGDHSGQQLRSCRFPADLFHCATIMSQDSPVGVFHTFRLPCPAVLRFSIYFFCGSADSSHHHQWNWWQVWSASAIVVSLCLGFWSLSQSLISIGLHGAPICDVRPPRIYFYQCVHFAPPDISHYPRLFLAGDSPQASGFSVWIL